MTNSKPPAILQLEQELEIEFTEVSWRDFEDETCSACFTLDELSEVISLRLCYYEIDNICFLSHFSKLRFLDLSGNEISNLGSLEQLSLLTGLDLSNNIISELRPLQPLTRLTSLKLEKNQISDLRPLSNLKGVTSLRLSSNLISELEPLQTLVNLKFLKLDRNQISNLNPLINLKSLTTVSLSYNQISDLNAIHYLPNLVALNLRNNQLREISLEFLDKFQKLEWINISANHINNLPEEIFNNGRNIFAELRHYLEGIAKAQCQIYQAKMILIGNGRVGKTCVVKRWLDNTFNPNEPSTHAIQLRRHPLEPLARQKQFTHIQLNVWDFGGQDIYHATHRLFMKTRALFVLVWDAQTEANLSQTESLSDAEFSYQNYPLRYWLDYAKNLGNNSPVIVVQTQRDRDGRQPIPQELRETYNIIDYLAVESSEEEYNGFEEFVECLEAQLETMLESSCTALPAAWWQVQQQIQELQEQLEKTITLYKFEQLCEKADLNSAEARTLLQYLHDIGLLFYRENLFQNQIILDQKWVIEAVYTLFDRNGLFPRLIHTGEFSTQDLQYVWRDFSQAEQYLFLGFMESCEICFEIIDEDEWEPFEQRRFLAPALLPDKKPAELQIWEHIESKWFVRYQYRFLHYGNLQSFLVRTHRWAPRASLWKNGCQLKDEHGNLALVEGFFAREAQYLQICVTGKNPQILLDRIRNELEKIQRDDHVTESLSLDGTHFVEREQLTQHPPENPRIQATDGTWLKYHDFQHFLQKNPEEVFMPDKKVVKIFVSYAHQDEKLRELLVAGLERHLTHRSVEYKFWVDKDIRLGEKWKERITQSLKDTDAALLLVSSFFAASEFINHEELPIFFERKQAEGYLIIPVLVRDYNFKHFEEVSKLQFFCPKYVDYGFADLLKTHEMMPFDEIVENEKVAEKYRENYYKALADRIDNVVQKT